ncbi:mitochondrial fission process protein 1 [Willisornis vidua]|uniref:Mitochondrial fission process protein 1 n=1 Tax=Willisornis vidua TaxID=1566151 RepID=A0ABQ9CYS0_9PASS|nr:mitochondrial fission process protein 1 [Willisornis vidua]
MWWDDSHDWSAAMGGYKLFRKNRQGRRVGGVALYVRESLVSAELKVTDNKVECLWTRIRGKVNKADNLMGVCYRPPNQDEEGDELYYKQLVDVLKLPVLVLMGDFNLLDIYWELNTAEKRQGRLLECIEDKFLLQLDNKKPFYRYSNSKRRGNENVHSVLDMEGNRVIKDEQKAEVFNTFFTSVFNCKTGCSEDSQALELVDRDKKLNNQPHCNS